MHDPMTVAFDIKYPWQKYRKRSPERTRDQKLWGKRGYHETFITIWHHDPERDGSDDSCGWSSPKLTKEQRESLSFLASEEGRSPYYLAFRGKKIDSPTEAETLLRQAFYQVGLVLARRYKVKQPTINEVSAWACEMLANSMDNFRTSLAFLPGYHSNSETDNAGDREYCAQELFCNLARFILRERRPWYKHPKFHVWHWSIQIQPVQAFKRWAFSRCSKCGRRFTWGYAPTTNSWNGIGPRWFRAEPDVFHGNCSVPEMGAGQGQQTNA